MNLFFYLECFLMKLLDFIEYLMSILIFSS